MSKLATFTVLLFVISFGIYQQQTETTQESIHVITSKISNGFTVKDKDYTLNFEVDNTNKKQPILVIDIKLHNDSKYISPHAKREFTGKFYMDLGSYKNLSFKGRIIETPQSVEEFDPHPFAGGTVNWVRENTSYKQALKIKTQKDFEVFGKLQFTIEPRCSLEEIPFAISFKNGEIKRIFSPKC